MLESYIRSRLKEKKILLMTHIVIGYPSLDASLAIVRTMVEAGVDLMELQIPFSEPIADGPVILKANQDALADGVTVPQCLEFGQTVASQFSIPFLYMTYYNILFKYGVDRFADHMRDAGLKGAIVPDLPPEEAAEGVLTILNANMANAIRSRTIQKGIDPRGFALVAMGGAGPLHGAEVARMLSIPEVLVPPYPGITSAMGLLTTDLKYDLTRTQFQLSTAVDIGRINADLAAMETALTEQFAEDHIPPEEIAFTRMADMRYQGQGYELTVQIPAGEIDTAALETVWDSFHAAHAAEYGHAFTENPIEIVNLRVVARAQLPKLAPLSAAEGGSREAAFERSVDTMFRIDGTLQSFETAVYRRADLPVDEAIPGPAIVTQKDSTTVVPPDATFRLLPSGSLLITLGEPK